MLEQTHSPSGGGLPVDSPARLHTIQPCIQDWPGGQAASAGLSMLHVLFAPSEALVVRQWYCPGDTLLQHHSWLLFTCALLRGRESLHHHPPLTHTHPTHTQTKGVLNPIISPNLPGWTYPLFSSPWFCTSPAEGCSEQKSCLKYPAAPSEPGQPPEGTVGFIALHG